MLPVYPFVGLLVKTSVRSFFTNRQPRYVVQLMYVNCMRVHCHDVCTIAPPTCISVNYVEIPLNVIRPNVRKPLVSHKAVQSLCSDVVVQNAKVIFSPTCKVPCFKKHHHVSPMKCFMLETSPFAVTPSKKLPSSSPLLPPSSSSSSPLPLNPPSSSSSLVLFYISLTSEIRMSSSYLNSSVFLFN